MKKGLPENVCQVGEPGGNKKVLIEEYVISFLQENSKKTKDPQIIVFYGDGYEEKGIKYYYLKGAAAHRASGDTLNKMDEFYFQTIGKQYFPKWKGIGWYYSENGETEVLEMLQNMREQKFQALKGYYIYFEKNTEMEEYMLHQQKRNKNDIDVGNERETEAGTKSDTGRAAGNLQKKLQVFPGVQKPFLDSRRPAPIAAVQILNMVSLCILIICCIIAVTTLNQYDKMKQLEETVSYLETSMEEEKNLPEE